MFLGEIVKAQSISNSMFFKLSSSNLEACS